MIVGNRTAPFASQALRHEGKDQQRSHTFLKDLKDARRIDGLLKALAPGNIGDSHFAPFLSSTQK